MTNEIKSMGCCSQVSQPSEVTTTTSESQVSPFPSLNACPGVSLQPRTASLTTTTVPVWVHAPPRTQTLGGDSNQEFVSRNLSMFPPKVTRGTPVTSDPASFFVFSASKAVSTYGQSAMNKPRLTLHPSRKHQVPLTMPTKETSQNSFGSPSTTASRMYFSSPEPSTSAVPKTSSATASSMFFSLPELSTSAVPKTSSATASSMFFSLPEPSTSAVPKTSSATASSMFFSSPEPSTSAVPKTSSATASSMFFSSPEPSTSAVPKTSSTTASSMFFSSPEPSTSAVPKTSSATASSMFFSSLEPSISAVPKMSSATASNMFFSSPEPSTSAMPKTSSATASSMFFSSPEPSTSAVPKTSSATASNMFFSSPEPSTSAVPKTSSATASSMFFSSPEPSTSAVPKTSSATASSMFFSSPEPSTSAVPKMSSAIASNMFFSSPEPSTSAVVKTLPSTTASSMFSSTPGPSTSAAPKLFSFKHPTTSTENVFSNVKTIRLPLKKDFKFNSYPTQGKNNWLPIERRYNIFNCNNTLNSSQSASSRSTNANTFGLRGSLFNAMKNYPKENSNTSGQSPLHPSNRMIPAKFVPPIEGDTYGLYGRIQSITAMPEYSLMSFEEIRLEYYRMQKKTFVFGPSAFSFNTPYFFSSKNKETKELAHKEVQTLGDNDSDTVYVKGLFNDIWRILECLICLDTVKSPIMQCESGHHFCNECWSKVTVCPVCKRKRTNVRNYALESMFEKLPTSCKYHDEGCEAMLIPKDKEKHESTCCFRPFICPIESCVQKVDQKCLMSHCVTYHDIPISVVECTLDNRSYVWNTENAELRGYICVFNLLQWGMFLLCHKEVEHTSCIWLQLLHINCKDSSFMYEIQLSDTENCQSVSYKGPVTRLSFNAEEAKHKCLRISSELLFVMRSAAFQMKLEIWKKNFVPT